MVRHATTQGVKHMQRTPKPTVTYALPAKGITKCPPALASKHSASKATCQHVAALRKAWQQQATANT